jgi:hypothetical protein
MLYEYANAKKLLLHLPVIAQCCRGRASIIVVVMGFLPTVCGEMYSEIL